MNGDGLATRTTWLSTSCIDSTRVFTAVSSPSFIQIHWAGPQSDKSACSFSLMVSKSALCILHVGEATGSEDWEVKYGDDREVVCLGWMNGGVNIA